LAALLASHMVGTIWMPQPLAVAAGVSKVQKRSLPARSRRMELP
jgi:hypothetical protein